MLDNYFIKKKLLPIGDTLAIFFFMLLIIYFSEIKNRTLLEDLLLSFVYIAFIADFYFTINHYSNIN